jgi:hypothetical protein
MNKRKYAVIGLDCLVIVALYWLYFGQFNNPFNEFHLIQKGVKTQGTVTYIDGLSTNESNSVFFFHPYHYNFVTSDGITIQAEQQIFYTLKDQPLNQSPSFKANVTYLKDSPNVSSFTSTLATGLLDFFFRKILGGLLWVSIIYIPLRLLIRYERRQSKKIIEEQVLYV